MKRTRIYTGQRCSCKRGIDRNNCPQCEGTGQVIDFRAMRVALDMARKLMEATAPEMMNEND
jgi:DnaJ-class molecular chaperone